MQGKARRCEATRGAGPAQQVNLRRRALAIFASLFLFFCVLLAFSASGRQRPSQLEAGTRPHGVPISPSLPRRWRNVVFWDRNRFFLLHPAGSSRTFPAPNGLLALHKVGNRARLSSYPPTRKELLSVLVGGLAAGAPQLVPCEQGTAPTEGERERRRSRNTATYLLAKERSGRMCTAEGG